MPPPGPQVSQDLAAPRLVKIDKTVRELVSHLKAKSPYNEGRSSCYGPLLTISGSGDFFYSIFLFYP